MARIKMAEPVATKPVEDLERLAIQEEGATLTTEQAIAQKMNDAVRATTARLAASEGVTPPPLDLGSAQKALGPGFFGSVPTPSVDAIGRLVAAQANADVAPKPAAPLAPSSAVVNNASFGGEGEEVTWTHGEELYGKQGTFSQYRVGPFTGRTRVGPGETHAAALQRLKTQLRAEADEERAAAHERFMAHWKKNIAG